jgi:hypothetical protein
VHQVSRAMTPGRVRRSSERVSQVPRVEPWGSGEFREIRVGRDRTAIQGPDGLLWDSVRDAFHGQALNMCLCERQDDFLELIRVMLRAISLHLHRIDPEALVAGLFEGGELAYRSFLLMLGSVNLVDHERSIFQNARLSPTGARVLAMLEATRPHVSAGSKDPTDVRICRIQAAERDLFA